MAEKAKGSFSVEELVNVVTDKSTMKKFRAFVEKEKGRLSESEKAEIRALERKALDLWKLGVKARAGGRCEFPGCKKIKFLNAHHIESYTTNRTLRYDLENGICLCPTHHKFGWLSAHRSFCFMYRLLSRCRAESLDYLLVTYEQKVQVTKVLLRAIIEGLSVYAPKKKGKEMAGKS